MGHKTDSFDPLVHYDELVMRGEAPDPREYAARYPQQPDLFERIERLEKLRSDLGVLSDDREPPCPTEIGGYRLSERLGRGGMGTVFRGRDQSGDAYAIKLARPSSSVALKRFSREAQLALQLDHPGIARVRGHGTEAGWAYIATELVEGVSLRELLDEVWDDVLDPRSWLYDIDRVCVVARKIALALAVAHNNQVIHRDIKPSNIMMQTDGEPKIIDFGIALKTAARREVTRITRTGVFIGSHNYAAPEQLRGEKGEVGPWTDCYGLGTTLYEMLTGRTPFACPTYIARLACVDHKPPMAPRKLNAKVSSKLNSLVLRALAPKHKKRFRDGDAMATALGRV